MKKNPDTYHNRKFWPTDLAYRTSHCYVLPEHGGIYAYGGFPHLERPRVGRPRQGPRLRIPKRVRLRPAHSNFLDDLPF